VLNTVDIFFTEIRMSDELQQTTDTTAETAAPEAAAAPQLQLQDLLSAAQIIQLASTRGAFRPEEFTTIGKTFESIVGFLQASGALKPAETAPAADGAEQPAEQTPAE
jgi:hypothetical protein